MKLQAPPPQELWDTIARQFSVTVLNGADIIPESNEHYVVSLLYAMSQQAFAFGELIAKESDPRAASCDALVELAARDGVLLRDAVPYSGYVKMTGKAGAKLRQNLEFQIGENKYSPAETLPPQMPPDGALTLLIEAQEPGSGFAPQEKTGRVSDAPEGIDAEITLLGAFCGGRDAESCEELRARYLSRLQYRPRGNLSWIIEKAKEYPCVTDICLADNALCVRSAETAENECPADLQLYALFNGNFPCGIAPPCVIERLNDWLFGVPRGFGAGELPFGVCGQVRVCRAAYVTIRIDGMRCATADQQTQAETALKSYIAGLCPNDSLTIDNLSAALAQILGTGNFKIVIDIPADSEGVKLSRCGDAEAELDYKICLGGFEFVNMQAPAEGCWN